MEPPPHTHTREDEGFFIVAGRWTSLVGGQTFAASLELPPIPHDIPIGSMLALDRELGIAYPDFDGG